jgi:hypothetical protein
VDRARLDQGAVCCAGGQPGSPPLPGATAPGDVYLSQVDADLERLD